MFRKISPSSIFCTVNIGEVIRIDGRTHMLVQYDSVNAWFTRIYWIDLLAFRASNLFGRGLRLLTSKIKEIYGRI